MTYFRRKTSYFGPGWADDPDSLHQEFQHCQDHLSSLDQNNVAQATLDLKQIPNATSPASDGISDMRSEHVGIPGGTILPIWKREGWSYFESGPVTSVEKRLTISADDARWQVMRVYHIPIAPTDPEYDVPLELKVTSAKECAWLLGACCEVGTEESFSPTTIITASKVVNFGVRFDIRLSTSTGGSAAATGTGNMGNDFHATGHGLTQAVTPLVVNSMILPAGETTIKLLYRATWAKDKANFPPVKINQARIFAVGLYK